MKKLTSVILILALTSLNFVSANDYYNYLHSDNVEIVDTQSTDKNIDIETPNNITNIENTEESFKGSVVMPYEEIISADANNTSSTYTISNDNFTTANNTTAAKDKKEPDNRSFSEKHPFVSALGGGLVLAGILCTAVAVAAADDNSLDHRNHRHHYNSSYYNKHRHRY